MPGQCARTVSDVRRQIRPGVRRQAVDLLKTGKPVKNEITY